MFNALRRVQIHFLERSLGTMLSVSERLCYLARRKSTHTYTHRHRAVLKHDQGSLPLPQSSGRAITDFYRDIREWARKRIVCSVVCAHVESLLLLNFLCWRRWSEAWKWQWEVTAQSSAWSNVLLQVKLNKKCPCDRSLRKYSVCLQEIRINRNFSALTGANLGLNVKYDSHMAHS